MIQQIQLVVVGLLFAGIAYFAWSYSHIRSELKITKENYAKATKAYEETIQVIETKTKAETANKESKKGVVKTIKKLDKLKEERKDEVIVDSDEYSTVSF